GWDTTVLVPDEPGTAADRLRRGGVDVVQLPLHRVRARPDPRLQARFLLRLGHEVRAIAALRAARRIELVRVRGLLNPPGARAARAAGVPVVWQLVAPRPPRLLRAAMMPIVARLADVVMATGRAVAAAHPGAQRLGDRLVDFAPPVDTHRFRPAPARRAAARARLGL